MQENAQKLRTSNMAACQCHTIFKTFCLICILINFSLIVHFLLTSVIAGVQRLGIGHHNQVFNQDPSSTKINYTSDL